MDATRAPWEHREAANAWCDWALAQLGMQGERIDPPGEPCAQPTALPQGEAISPQRAVLCIREQQRTAVFLRAMDAAIRLLRERFPGETIHVVDAGCGPAAALSLPFAARYAASELQVTLLDMHAASLDGARRLARELGVEASIRACVCGDATQARFSAAERPHLIVSEVLRRALKKEPQVEVTRTLAPQLRAGGVFLPERIEIDLGFQRGTVQEKSVERLGRVFTLDALRAGELTPENGSLAAATITVPAHEWSRERLQLFTQIEVFRGHWLGDFACSLTMPENLRYPEDFARTGGAAHFSYEISTDPGLRFEHASPAKVSAG